MTEVLIAKRSEQTSVGFSGDLEIIPLVFVEEREELLKGLEEVSTDVCLVASKPLLVASEAVTHANWVIYVQH